MTIIMSLSFMRMIFFIETPVLMYFNYKTTKKMVYKKEY